MGQGTLARSGVVTDCQDTLTRTRREIDKAEEQKEGEVIINDYFKNRGISFSVPPSDGGLDGSIRAVQAWVDSLSDLPFAANFSVRFPLGEVEYTSGSGRTRVVVHPYWGVACIYSRVGARGQPLRRHIDRILEELERVAPQDQIRWVWHDQHGFPAKDWTGYVSIGEGTLVPPPEIGYVSVACVAYD